MKKIIILVIKHFFSYFKKIPISVIIRIIEYFILDNKNTTEIKKANSRLL